MSNRAVSNDQPINRSVAMQRKPTLFTKQKLLPPTSYLLTFSPWERRC